MPNVYDVLVPELQGDPLARGYAGMTDAARLASLTTQNRTRPRRVGSIDLLRWGAQSGRLARVKKAAAKAVPYAELSDEAWSVAIVADALVARPDAGFDPSSAEHVAIVDVLVAASVLTAGDKTALLALASEPCSRAQELGLTGLGLGHLASARQMIGG